MNLWIPKPKPQRTLYKFAPCPYKCPSTYKFISYILWELHPLVNDKISLKKGLALVHKDIAYGLGSSTA